MKSARLPMFICGVGAAFFLLFGLWAFLDARSFFDQLAPFNAHFLHDIGAFQIGIGATLALALWRSSDALFAALGGAGVGSVFHAVAHLNDHDLGGSVSDPIVFGVVALLLLGGATMRFSARST